MSVEYRIGDAVSELGSMPDESASLIHLDDAWARPKRGDEYSDAGKYGVNYPTHELNTTRRLLDICKDILRPGGWLIADADDWLLPRLVNYLRDEWGDVAESYSGGGFRRVGGVTSTTKSGTVDRSTPGQYLSNGGYPVVFAHKGETDRRTPESARQIAERQRNDFGWTAVKPLSPYEVWLDALLERGDHVVEPCAGTAPAAIAAERLWGDGARVTCIDIEADAREAYRRRREAELGDDQPTLSEAVDD